MFSAIPPTADVRHGISKAYRFTLQMPACITVDAIGRVDPAATDALPLARFGQVISGAAEIVRQRRERRACQPYRDVARQRRDPAAACSDELVHLPEPLLSSMWA
jgi:hypothetical protein